MEPKTITYDDLAEEVRPTLRAALEAELGGATPLLLLLQRTDTDPVELTMHAVTTTHYICVRLVYPYDEPLDDWSIKSSTAAVRIDDVVEVRIAKTSENQQVTRVATIVRAGGDSHSVPTEVARALIT